MCLSLGLLFMGQKDKIEGVMMAISAIQHPIKSFLDTTIRTCAYANTGSVLEIQSLLTILAENIKPDEDETDEAKKQAAALKNTNQEVAVLGLAMVSMGEKIASTMALRMLDHLLQYAEVNVRRVVPLAMALLSVSEPAMTIVDTLAKLSHDTDEKVSQNAVFALGIVGAGTNNSRIAGMLRNLAVFYGKEPNHLFLVRIAQGLLHLGKGLLTINPFFQVQCSVV
jgi:26S proteasome regulatory subunit N1